MSVTIEHQAPLELLERFPDLLPSLLREQFGRPVPPGARMRPVSSDHTVTVAQELRSDSAVLIELGPEQPPVCAAVVESQRSVDPQKWYSWPRYLSELHDKHRCPSYLVVFALGENAAAVEAWARQPIPTFQPGSGFAPLVIGPPEVSVPATLEAVKADLPRAALGALLHLGDADGAQLAYRTLRAAYELHGLDLFVWMYYLVRGIVGDERFAEIERLTMFNRQIPFVPRTDFEREHFYRGQAAGEAKGQAKGEAKGKAEALLAVLAARGLAVSESQRSRLLACTDVAQLDRLITGAVSAASVDVLLTDL